MPSAPEAELDELYKDLILDHYRRPRNRRPVADPKVVGEGYNPLCGDEIAVEVHFEGDVMADVGFEGRGCSLSQASGSMMTEAVKGKTADEAHALSQPLLGRALLCLRIACVPSTGDYAVMLDARRDTGISLDQAH